MYKHTTATQLRSSNVLLPGVSKVNLCGSTSVDNHIYK